MVRAVSLAGCFQPGAPLSLAAEKQLLLRHCLFDGNKYKPFGAVCQRVVSRGKGKISRVKQKETSERMSLFTGAEGGIRTLAPLLTAYSLSRGAPSATWVLPHTYLFSGGESGIRTHGCFHIAGFQDRCFRPLSHLSVCKSVSRAKREYYITMRRRLCQQKASEEI